MRFKEYFEEADRKYQRLKYIKIKKEMMVRSEKARQYIEAFNERQSIAEQYFESKTHFYLRVLVQFMNWKYVSRDIIGY